MCVLQVSFKASVHRQSFTVEVFVIDKNDNVPVFIEESMRGSVQLGLLKGTRTKYFILGHTSQSILCTTLNIAGN